MFLFRSSIRAFGVLLNLMLALSLPAQTVVPGEVDFIAGLAALAETDADGAARHLRKAAEAGHPGAMYQLGILYAQGYGVEKSVAECIRWHRAAAEAGNADAMYDLGARHAHGLGLPLDHAEKFRWWQLAAEAGQTVAMFSIGLNFERGLGTAPDDQQAVTWYERAAVKGHPEAAEKLAALRAAGRDKPVNTALTTWIDATTEALDAGVTAALRANDPHTAYLQARVWRRHEPQSAAAASALANVYMDLGAPAAALTAIKEALRFGPSPEIARSLRALKAQAHAETGEFAAAWTNARALAKESGESHDPVIQLVRQLQWTYFGALLAAGPVSAFEERTKGLTEDLQPENLDRLNEKLAAGTATLVDFDMVIASNRMTPDLWESRLAIAEAGDDWPEMVWSATLAWRDQPDTLAAWGDRQLAANEASIKAAANLVSEGNVDTAIGMLLSALARDPAQAEAWAALQQAAVKAGDEQLALDVLTERWRLDPPEFIADGTALALAARHARWELLLAMSDARILADDTDSEAHYHRLLTAAALGLPGLAGDSTPALNATVYEERARLLHAVARGLDQLDGSRFNDEETGLASVQKSLAWSEADEATRLFLALAVQFSGEALPGQPALWTSLLAGADPATTSHLEFIRGRVDTAAYRARHPDGPAEALAQFLERYTAALREKTPAARAQVRVLADDQTLPLVLRAAAEALGAVDQPYSPLPLRAADRYHAAARTDDWPAVRAALAPGQEVMVGGSVDLSIWKGAPVLRLAAYSFSRTDVTGSATLEADQLWELRGVQALEKATWTLRSDALLVCEGTIFLDQRFEGTGSYWFEDTELRRSQIYANDLLLSESVWDNPQFFVYRRAEFVRSTGRSANFALGSDQTKTIPSSVAAFLGCTVANDTGTFGLRSGVRLHLRDTTLFAGQAPKFDQVAEVSVSNSVLITPGAVTELPAGLAHHRLPANSHTYIKGQRPGSISTVEELEAALAQASPGHTLRLNPGEYRLTKTLDLPDGVALRGPHFVETNGTWARGKAVLYVDTKDAVDPLIRVKSGVAMLEGVSLEARTSGSVTSKTGVVFQQADPRQERVAVLAEGNARLRLARVDVSGWHAQATLKRAELRAEGDALMLVEDSRPRLIHLRSNARVALFLPLQGYDSFFGAHGEGEFFGALGNRGRLHLRGENLRFHGLVRAGYQIAYLDGMVDARRLAWRQRARTTLWSVLAETAPLLATDLAAAPSLDARLTVLNEFSIRLGQLVRVAHPDPAELGRSLHRVLTPLLETYRSDAGPMFEVVHVRNYAFPRAAGRAHLDALPAHLKAPIQGYIKATFAAPGLPTPGVSPDRARVHARLSTRACRAQSCTRSDCPRTKPGRLPTHHRRGGSRQPGENAKPGHL